MANESRVKKKNDKICINRFQRNGRTDGKKEQNRPDVVIRDWRKRTKKKKPEETYRTFFFFLFHDLLYSRSTPTITITLITSFAFYSYVRVIFDRIRDYQNCEQWDPGTSDSWRRSILHRFFSLLAAVSDISAFGDQTRNRLYTRDDRKRTVETTAHVDTIPPAHCPRYLYVT